MRIAVTYEDGNVAERMGLAPEVLICDAEDGKITNSFILSTKGHGHAKLPAFLVENNVNVVIGCDYGEPMKNAIAQTDLKLVAGISGDAKQAVEDLLAGKIG